MKFIEYKERTFGFYCLITSIVPSEIGEAWIVMLRKDYRLTLEILYKLKRLYRFGFRRLRRSVACEINKANVLPYKIENWSWDRSEYSKLYRMKLMLEKNMQLNNLICEV